MLDRSQNQPVGLEALVDYLKGSDFLQELARHVWVFEQHLRSEIAKLQEDGQRSRSKLASPLESTDSDGQGDQESLRNGQESVALRKTASPRNAIPRHHALPKAFSKLAASPTPSECDPDEDRSGTMKQIPSNVDSQLLELPRDHWQGSERMAHVPVFADAETMKEKVRLAISQKPYRVEDFYVSTGYPQAIARNTWFEGITLAIIAVNSVWIAVDIDLNEAASILEAKPVFILIDNFFLAFFTFEWCMRFLAFREKKLCLQDGWFVFDSVLLFLMWIDTYILPIFLKVSHFKGAGDTSVFKLLRMMRITRMARMARLLKALPELTILIKGIWVAARSVFFTLWLLTIIVYIFAVAFRQLTDGLPIQERYFKSVPFSMKSLLLYGVLPDQAEIIENIGDEHFLLGAFSLVFILLASLTVMNMLIGVLVEVVSVVSSVEKEELKVNFVMSKLKYMLETSGLDANHDMKISKKELEVLLLDPAAAKIIMDVGVDPVGLVDFADYIFAEAEEGLSFPRFIEVVLQFRGSNTATVRDVVDLRKVSLARFVELRETMEDHAILLQKLIRGNDYVRKCLSQRNAPSDSEVIRAPRSPAPLPPTVSALRALQ